MYRDDSGHKLALAKAGKAANKFDLEFGMKMVFIISLIAFVGFLVLFLSDEYNWTAVLGSEGFVDTGSKFGVSVGGLRSEASAKLSDRGLVLEESFDGGSCLNRSYPDEQNVEVWSDRSWRRGTICLASENNQVVSIGWFYSWMQP